MAKRVMVVFGTRPEAIKCAPLIGNLLAAPDLETIVVSTGQHRQMLDQAVGLFSIRPHYDLNVMKPAQSLSGVTCRVLHGIKPVIQREKPDAVIVQGDTTTAFAGALAAFYEQVPVVHLEAGLRTGDPLSPYPEEMNRRLITQLSVLHLTPTSSNRDNLLAEGVERSSVVTIGNTGIDALLEAAATRNGYVQPELRFLDDDSRRVLLVTTHRRESWGAPMAEIGRAVATIARGDRGLLVVIPMHLNPVVRQVLAPAVRGIPNVLVTEPVSYMDFVHLMIRSSLILTDSGGVQEEGPSLGKPVLVLRDTTERPEAMAFGTARLVGTGHARILDGVRSLLYDAAAYTVMANATNPYGDGHAAARAVAAIRCFFGLGLPAVEFVPIRTRLTATRDVAT
jgi:UDP-N-acetylglucosamine 2-epimerase (non-hydrolysing)